jgi:hypothetical protein
MVEEDGLDVGYSSIEDGCMACAPTFIDGEPVYPSIKPQGRWLRCVKCGGGYGPVPDGVLEPGEVPNCAPGSHEWDSDHGLCRKCFAAMPAGVAGAAKTVDGGSNSKQENDRG